MLLLVYFLSLFTPRSKATLPDLGGMRPQRFSLILERMPHTGDSSVFYSSSRSFLSPLTSFYNIYIPNTPPLCYSPTAPIEINKLPSQAVIFFPSSNFFVSTPNVSCMSGTPVPEALQRQEVWCGLRVY